MANLPTSIKNLNTLLGEQLTEGEGGGGGSSDFSTAEVTMNSLNFMPLPYIKDGNLVYEYPPDTGIYTVPVPSHDGSLIITIDGNIPITATGSATVKKNTPTKATVTITGDCTLTVED